MLSKLFSNIKLGSSLWLVFISVSVWSLNTYLYYFSTETELSPQFWGILFGVFGILVFALLLFQNIFEARFKITKANYFAPFLLALFLGWFPENFTWLQATQIVITCAFYFNSFLILEGNRSNLIGNHMTSGFLALLLTLIAPQGIIFLLLSLWQAGLNGESNIRKFILPLYSFTVSLILLLCFAFFFNQSEIVLSRIDLRKWIGLDVLRLKTLIVPATMACLYFILSQGQYIKALRKAPVLKRKSLLLLNMHFVFAAVAFVTFGSQTGALITALFPLAVLFANFLQYLNKNAVKETLIWLTIIAGIAMNAIHLL